MSKIYKKWNAIPLIRRIAVGLLIGAVLGLFAPELTFLSIFGSVFVGALKAVAPILVFILIISSLASANGQIGKQFRTVIIL